MNYNEDERDISESTHIEHSSAEIGGGDMSADDGAGTIPEQLDRPSIGRICPICGKSDCDHIEATE